MSSSSEEEDVIEETRKRKKGVRHVSDYKKEVIKRSRLLGKEYVNTRGNVVMKKTNTDENCDCKEQCTSKYSFEDKLTIFTHLYDGKPKDQQDTYLMGLIESSEVKRRRSKNPEPAKNRANSFTYFCRVGSVKQKVCRKAFMILHSIKNKAVFRLARLVVSGEVPKDCRGRHENRGNALSNEVIQKIDQHILSFPCKESHYSTKLVKYLSADLNVQIMYNMFCEKFPNLKGVVKYDFYRKYYRENYDFRFGRPQVDVCSKCELLTTKIMSTSLNENAKRVAVAEKCVHIRKAKKFYSKQKEIAELCKSRNDVSALVFDYMQNLPLPKLPVQEMFYLRKLWLYAFCIHDIGKNEATFFTYHEGEGKRGPDEVCTFLKMYIEQKIDPSVKELYIFSDACGGQNRNHTVIRFWLALSMSGRFEKIVHFFPERGHSFLPCDRDFGTAKRIIRKMDRIYTPEEYELLLASARKDGSFSVRIIRNDEILDFKSWWPKYFKKTCQELSNTSNKKEKFAISQYKQFEMLSSNPGYLVASDTIGGLVKRSFRLVKPKVVVILPRGKVYNGKIPIKVKKVEDVRKIVQYIPHQKQGFYNSITTWPTTQNDASDDEDA